MIKTTLSLAIAAALSAPVYAGHNDKPLVIEILWRALVNGQVRSRRC